MRLPLVILAASLAALPAFASNPEPAGRLTSEAEGCARRVIAETRAAVDQKEGAWGRLVAACNECGARLSKETPKTAELCTAAADVVEQASASSAPKTRGGGMSEAERSEAFKARVGSQLKGCTDYMCW
jgi:hypothetical protein